jgi:hypothetical protein
MTMHVCYLTAGSAIYTPVHAGHRRHPPVRFPSRAKMPCHPLPDRWWRGDESIRRRRLIVADRRRHLHDS